MLRRFPSATHHLPVSEEPSPREKLAATVFILPDMRQLAA